MSIEVTRRAKVLVNTKRMVAGKGRWGIIVTSIPEGRFYRINVGFGLWLLQ
jgi:hypothetical protein